MQHPYGAFVKAVERPARYLGGEYGSVVKDPASVDVRVVLAFPDAYEIGMSHLGTRILYDLLNQEPRIACERAFAPWVDLEVELRRRGLPLVSLETATALRSFDVVGISLQYELTYTNVLTLLDLGGIPLRAAARGAGDPLVLGGGPCATHPEPVAPFFDAFWIGEAEEELPEFLLAWATLHRRGAPRHEALAQLAARFPLYVPALYEVGPDPATGLWVVRAPRDPRAPGRVRRGLVPDLDAFPFPTSGPVPYAEAVFERAAVEIARGCTEGCRFCQAGMIYRPVRERSPRAIMSSLLGLVDAAGYDEASLTSLSTADFSCLTPLVQNLMACLRERKVSLGVSSLRAYGLDDALLDEIASVRATGLTFAPEAGTQRMRDVINKNITEEQIHQAAERVFRRGFTRLKLYFMIGQPTETDEDVLGIVDTGAAVLALGRRIVGGAADVTVSVSSHVPRPHTPFQFCAMDLLEEIECKQRLLRAAAEARTPRVRLKTHDPGASHLEGILALGDRRLAEVIEHAYRAGARFDGWDELFDLGRFRKALEACGLSPEPYLCARSIDGRTPWDHIDVGLEEGFLAKEYQRALAGRASPPCGKPIGFSRHATNLVDAARDERKLVCYHCGVACDLAKMREDRLEHLRALGALEPHRDGPTEPQVARAPGRPQPRPRFVQGEGTRYRLRYSKLLRAAYISHLDLMRLLARAFRRAGLPVIYSLGFHPKPRMTFGPALGLGIPSLGELLEVRVDAAPEPEELIACLNRSCPEGVRISAGVKLHLHAPGLGRVIRAADWLVAADPGVIAVFRARSEVPVVREGKVLAGHSLVLALEVVDGEQAGQVRAALGWPQASSLVRARVAVCADGSLKPAELAAALGVPGAPVARLGLVGRDGEDPVSAARARPAALEMEPDPVRVRGIQSESEVDP